MNKYFEVKSIRINSRKLFPSKVGECQATIKIRINGESFMNTDEGNGPLNAFDNVLRRELRKVYKEINDIRVVDYGSTAINVEERGSTAKVVATVFMRFNGDHLQFKGRDTHGDMAGCMALIKGYHECLKQIYERKGDNHETIKISVQKDPGNRQRSVGQVEQVLNL